MKAIEKNGTKPDNQQRSQHYHREVTIRLKVTVTTTAKGQVEGNSDYLCEGFWLKAPSTISAKVHAEGSSDYHRGGSG